jgi:hypothetical protein
MLASVCLIFLVQQRTVQEYLGAGLPLIKRKIVKSSWLKKVTDQFRLFFDLKLLLKLPGKSRCFEIFADWQAGE